MIVKLLTEYRLEFQKGGCRGSYESTHVKMQNCWKSHALSPFFIYWCLICFSGEIEITCDQAVFNVQYESLWRQMQKLVPALLPK